MPAGAGPVATDALHYHQSTDLLETVNHELVAETSKVTVATI